MERAVYRTDAPLITDIIFDPFPSSPGASLAAAEPSRAPAPASEAAAIDSRGAQLFVAAVQAFEIRLLRQALREARYHQKKAAQLLGLTYHQFRGLCRKYGDALTQ